MEDPRESMKCFVFLTTSPDLFLPFLPNIINEHYYAKVNILCDYKALV